VSLDDAEVGIGEPASGPDSPYLIQGRRLIIKMQMPAPPRSDDLGAVGSPAPAVQESAVQDDGRERLLVAARHFDLEQRSAFGAGEFAQLQLGV